MALLLSLMLAALPADVGGQILYLLHRGETKPAFQRYIEETKESQEHDFALLQQAGIRLLEEGVQSSDPEIQLMCMFGAGVAMSNELLPILERGIHSAEMRTQLIALSYLGRLQDDEADSLLLGALSSPFPLTRFEACFLLAKKNHPAVLGHLQSLMVKVPEFVHPLFPQIAIHLEGGGANAYIRKLLTDPNLEVRKEAVLTVAKAKRDDFLPQIRKLASGAHHVLQESCALALGELKDSLSLGRLRALLQSERSNVHLAAAIALYELGEHKEIALIKARAQQGDLFAIASLGKLRQGKEILAPLLSHPDRDVQLNATLALLQMRDERVADHLDTLLFEDQHDLGFAQISSPGGGMQAWKIIPAAHQKVKLYPALVSQTEGLRGRVLTQAIELPETTFTEIVGRVMESKQSSLIPLLVELLENKRMVDLLNKGREKIGAPMLRTYCTLALYKLGEEGPYEEELIRWVRQASHHALIRFEEPEPQWATQYTLTPEESSRVLVDTLQALASAQNQAGIEALLHAIAYGNPRNRYALAGLLIRTTE